MNRQQLQDGRSESLASIRQASSWARALLDDAAMSPVDLPRSVAAHPRGPTPSTDRYWALVERGVISAEALLRARRLQARSGGTIIEILTSWDTVDPETVAAGLALATGVRRVRLDEVGAIPEYLVARVDRPTALLHSFLLIGEGSVGTVVAVTDPLMPELRALLDEYVGGRYEIVVATRAEMSELMNRTFGTDTVRSATLRLAEATPDDSASVVITRAQKWVGAGLILLLVAGLVVFTLPALIVVNALTTFFYLVAAVFRLRIIQLATDPALGGETPEDPDAVRDDTALPIYTIFVPMYREASVVHQVVASLARLDYPAHKLDVLLICEEDDDETPAAIRAMKLGSQFRLLLVPDSKPKTKPKACNYAMEYARGDMAVIFDAEDDPEPDQLRRVLAALAAGGDDVACVQARLDYANAEQNLLTRFFTIEYMMWFDLILPGLERMDAPIPLGGTSNHFRMSVLRELGGWDPFNVTEDADLGVRLHKRGYRTLNIASRTMEEANSQLGNWIRQRSRWMKGHIQTWLVHNRNPARTRRELGWRGWIAFQLTIGASPLAALLNPIYWLLVVVWFATHLGVIKAALPSPVYYLASINLLVWNFLFVYAAAVGVARREATELVRYALLSPLYWALISVATWKGAIQLITKPFYWEKTVHGLDSTP